MQVRRFGKLDWKGSALGFGCMRLPIEGDDSTKTDEAEATRMLHCAVDRGLSYLDSGHTYHGGNSERSSPPGPQRRIRGKVRAVTKMIQ